MPDGSVDMVENTNNSLRDTETTQTYFASEISLSPEHRQYLLQRHGTLDLDPMPGPSDADPYNWPHWRVCTVRSI